MAAMKALDDFVSAEIRKIKPLNWFSVDFIGFGRPGCKYFMIKGTINKAAMEYRLEHNRDVCIRLEKDGDVISVYAKKVYGVKDGNAIQSVNVNDRAYREKEGSLYACIKNVATGIVAINDEKAGEELKRQLAKGENAESSEEASEAIEFGKKALAAVEAEIERCAPGILGLMKGYCRRTLLPLEENPALRTNAEIFEQFSF